MSLVIINTIAAVRICCFYYSYNQLLLTLLQELEPAAFCRTISSAILAFHFHSCMDKTLLLILAIPGLIPSEALSVWMDLEPLGVYKLKLSEFPVLPVCCWSCCIVCDLEHCLLDPGTWKMRQANLDLGYSKFYF